MLFLKVKPKDAASNLAYMFSHALYGITTTALVAKMGHPSLFDTKPTNYYLQPTEQTTEEKKRLSVMHRKSKVQDEDILYH